MGDSIKKYHELMDEEKTPPTKDVKATISRPTPELRYLQRKYRTVLQQKWVYEFTGESVWKDVPFVEDKN